MEFDAIDLRWCLVIDRRGESRKPASRGKEECGFAA
jgi:hypothetical protein